MTRSRWHSSWDVAAAATWLVILSIATGFVPLWLMGTRGADLVFMVVFGWSRAIALYWVLGRLWWLMRVDGGPARLVAWFIGISVFESAYTESWNSLVAGHAFQPALDGAVFFVRMGGLVLLAVALLRWSRVPDWAGWVLVAYIATRLVGFIGKPWLTAVPAWQLTGWLWTAFLVALVAALLRDARGVDTPSESVLAQV